MNPTRRTLLGALAGATALAGCLGEDDGTADEETDDTADDGSADEPTNDGSADGDAADEPVDEPAVEQTVQVRDHPEHGPILVDAEGLTLYMFDSDDPGAGESTCYDGCAESWPPLTVPVDDPSDGDRVEAVLSTFERADGETQVAAGGWPLYYWAGDAQPGDASGQGVNDVWWVLDPAGEPIREQADTGGGY